MKRLPLLAALLVATAAVAGGGYWTRTFYLLSKAGPEFRVTSSGPNSVVSIKVVSTSETDYTLEREEAAALGRALLDIIGQPEKPSCAFLKSYIEMRERQLGDPETGAYMRLRYETEIRQLRTKIQETALDVGCDK